MTNNYASFAGRTWKILRINSGGSIRMILDASAGNTTYQNSNVPTPHTIDAANSLIVWKILMLIQQFIHGIIIWWLYCC